MKQILSSAGYHGEGRLARKANSNQLSRITTDLPPLLMFACGWKHNVFITTDHQVYVCGDNGDGQIGPDQDSCLIPTHSKRLSALNPIWCSCGDKMTALLSEDGKIYTCGVGWGIGPIELNAGAPIVFVACGVQTVCGIGANGEFFFWASHAVAGVQLACDAQFCDCAAGNFQIFGLSTTGVLYVSGRSKTCGQGRKWSSTDLVPVLSLSGFVIRRIFAYCSHSVAIDEKGRVFVCGSNNYGQLGLGDVRKANTFQVLHVFDEHPVITASLGDTFTAFLTESFELYTCGDGDEYRLCNTAIGKVRIPTPADAAIGRSVMWMSCGCSHMIIAENLEEVPRHPGRSHFGLDGANRRKHRKLPSLMKSQPVVHLTKPVLADVSDFGTLWTGFLNGDIVRTGDFGEGIVVGMTSRGLAVEFRDGVRLFDLKDLRTVFGKLQIKKRDGAMFTQAVTRASARLPLDVSEGSCQVFGFVPGDRVEHPLLGGAIIQGMFGGGLWLAFDDDAGAIVTTLVNEPAYLHQWLKICQPNNRSIAYLSIGGQSWPVETAPCRVLHLYGLALGDLVDTGNSVGIIQGSFRFLAVVANALTGDLVLVPPPGILLLRHFGTAPVIVERLALNGSGVEIDVSCSESDEFMPFDRVVTQRGHATIVGRAEGKIWLATDDASALGGGAGTLPDTSQFRLVRRIAAKGVSKTGLSVSSDDFRGSRILPDDEVLVKGGRYIVLGMNNEKLVGIKSVSGGGTYLFPLSDFDECQIVYRADIPATRAYHSRAGTRLTLSVSLRDFLGKRFIPDDVIETPLGVGLVVGITDANVAIHLSGDDGVSFFTPQAIYDTALFKLKQRRAISSVIKRKDELA